MANHCNPQRPALFPTRNLFVACRYWPRYIMFPVDPVFSFQPFSEQIINEGKISIQISWKKPLRILPNTKQPLHTEFLHPQWCSFDSTGMKIKAGANTKHNTAYSAVMRCHPLFLLGCPKTYPNKIRIAFIDITDCFLILFFRHRTERR